MTEAPADLSAAAAPVQPVSTASVEEADRTLAAVAHVFGWITGTIVLVLAQKRSSFLRFHALQALVVDLALSLVSGLVGILMSGVWMFLGMGAMFLSLASTPPGAEPQPPVYLFAMFPLLFGVMFPCFGVMALLPWALRLYAVVRALGGHQYAYPLIHRWLKPPNA